MQNGDNMDDGNDGYICTWTGRNVSREVNCEATLYGLRPSHYRTLTSRATLGLTMQVWRSRNHDPKGALTPTVHFNAPTITL